MADMVGPRRLWPVDKLLLGYLGATSVLAAVAWRSLPAAPSLIGIHVAAAVLLLLAVRYPDSFPARVFRHWYPLPYVAFCYREMSLLIPALRGIDYDRQLAAWDFRIWGAHPTVWLEGWQAPWLVEALQIAYSTFVPAVLLVAFLLWRQRRFDEFRYYAFLIALGFLVSYVGYLLVPARGPRFVLAGLQTTELSGVWLFDWLRATLDQLESAHFDCFPSGHLELTLLAAAGSRVISKPLFGGYAAYSAIIAFATVYLRYHYTVDIAAGAVVAIVLIILTPPLYRSMGEGS